MNPLIRLKQTTAVFLIALITLCLGFSPTAQSVVPAPDGGYPGGNTAEGQYALFSLTTGTFNTAVGFLSLRNNTTGRNNTATGAGALFTNTTGFENSAFGWGALAANTTGHQNTATGFNALLSNTIGVTNSAFGWSTMTSNTTGNFNTAAGHDALYHNTVGNSNTAVGRSALQNNQTGNNNTAVGDFALILNTSGGGHTAVGYRALQHSTASGGLCFSNTAVGALALGASEDGCSNTALGGLALGNNISGQNNVAVGFLAGDNVTTANNVICIGTDVQGQNVSNSCYIGNIFNQVSASGVPVLVNANHRLGTTTSSKRFKQDIKPTGAASVTLYELTPVTFRYKNEIDPAGTSQFGLVAEDVEEVNPDLIIRDKEGKPYSVRYDQVNAMLLNEFLKEHRKNEEQEKTIAELKSGMTTLAATVKEQAAQIQKVSAQLEVSKPAPQTVLND